MMEECGIDTPGLEEIGRLIFEFVGDPQLLEVHVFSTTEGKGEPKESDGKF